MRPARLISQSCALHLAIVIEGLRDHERHLHFILTMGTRRTRARNREIAPGRLSELTIGFWQNVYKGDYGRVTFGAQYEYIKRKAFNGIGGAPSTDDNVAGRRLACPGRHGPRRRSERLHCPATV